MTTLVDEPRADSSLSPAQRLRGTMAAVALHFTWFGVRKSLNTEQKAQAADAFGAEGAYLSAGKKLIDTSHPAFKAVTALKSQIVQFLRSMSVPYPEPGIRLIRRDEIGLFDTKLTSLRQELDEAVANLDRHFSELKAAARRRLGRLYNPADYPESLVGLFGVTWEYPNCEPPAYLQQLSPALYEEESRRIAARFEECIRLAEEAFTEEFGKLVSHLSERLSGSEDGREKIFRDSAVQNLSEFFQRFRHLNVRSSEQLDQLVEQASRIVRGVQPQALRDDTQLRQQIASQLAGVQSQIEGMLVDRPRRAILRRPR
ncbi:MAG TPA: hypothetical protein VMP01_09900 [Pirellulaceae bacterium]|nr:hypothetical protein [Pirellulaceae bacterium]